MKTVICPICGTNNTRIYYVQLNTMGIDDTQMYAYLDCQCLNCPRASKFQVYFPIYTEDVCKFLSEMKVEPKNYDRRC